VQERLLFECRLHNKHKLSLHPPHEPPEISTDAITAVVGSQLSKTVHAIYGAINFKTLAR